MTDKEKIRKKVEIVVNRRLNLLNGDYFDLNKEVDGFTNEIIDIIDSLQEEPKFKIGDIRSLNNNNQMNYDSERTTREVHGTTAGMQRQAV